MSSRVIRRAGTRRRCRSPGGPAELYPPARARPSAASRGWPHAAGRGKRERSRPRATGSAARLSTGRGREEEAAANQRAQAAAWSRRCAALSGMIAELAGHAQEASRGSRGGRREAGHRDRAAGAAIASSPPIRKRILGLVKAAFQKVNARETHRLRVSPPDAADDSRTSRALGTAAGTRDRFRWLPDAGQRDFRNLARRAGRLRRHPARARSSAVSRTSSKTEMTASLNMLLNDLCRRSAEHGDLAVGRARAGAGRPAGRLRRPRRRRWAISARFTAPQGRFKALVRAQVVGFATAGCC